MQNTHDNIRFILGEETKPIIEHFEEDKYPVRNSIFYEQYKQALFRVADYLSSTEEYSVALPDEIHVPKFSHNNIFSFVGDRGSGKTSCMLTLNEMLIHANIEELFPQDKQLKKIKDTTFHYCDTINSSFFDRGYNILEVFIAMLLKRFNEEEHEVASSTANDECRRAAREVLLQNFRQTQNDLVALVGHSTLTNNKDTIRHIQDLEIAINFRESINRLINSFLNYKRNNSCKPDNRLLLCIDDIDLSISTAYAMVEQIRIYLNTPNLVILMSIEPNQLANAIGINYLNDYANIMKGGKEQPSFKRKDDHKEFINTMVERYISKLLPLSQRTYLPHADYLFHRNISVCSVKCVEGGITETLSSLQIGMLTLIYRKLRMRLFNQPGQTCYIIPRNLRELRNIIYLLCNMEDATNNVILQKNLNFFGQCFQDIWCANNLDENGRHILKNLHDIVCVGTLNHTVLQLLKSRFDFFGSRAANLSVLSEVDAEITLITGNDNVMYNISLGDVLACLDWLDKVCYEENDRKLLFAIKIFYSIKLNENLIKEDDTNGTPVAYHHIIAGNFFNATYLDIAPSEAGQQLRGRREINSDILNWILKTFAIRSNGSKDSETEESYSAPQSLSGEDARIITDRILQQDEKIRQLTEFFMLTTTSVIDPKESTVSNYRQKRSIYYQVPVSQYRKKVYFDVLSIFYNLIDIQRTYTRYENYNPSLLNWHQKQKGKTSRKQSSLYQLMLARVTSIPEEELRKKLLIHDIDLLEQISSRLQNNTPDASCNHFKVLKTVFDNLSQCELPLDESQRIKFDFFIPVSQLIEAIWSDPDPIYVKLFNAIYNNGK